MRHRWSRAGSGSLILLLVLAALALSVQIFPQLWASILWGIDVRNWSRNTWIIANALAVAFLIVVRYGPGIAKSWQERRQQTAKAADNQHHQGLDKSANAMSGEREQ